MKGPTTRAQTGLKEADIKAIILNLPQIRKLKPIVASEYFVGRRDRRADLAIMTGKMLGFEIKSDVDNLKRLYNQTDEYIKYFDEVIVVATTKHIPKILETARLDVSIWEVQPNRRIVTLREGVKSPTRSAKDLLRLLTKSEAQRLLHPLESGEAVQVDQVSTALAKAFEARHGATSRRFWEVVGRRSAKAADLELLSRFIDLRIKATERAQRSATFWADWHIAAEQLLPPSHSAS